MSRLRLPYVQAWVDDDGRARHYFRRKGCRRVHLPGLPGSPEFMAAYQSALDAAPPIEIGKRRNPAGSLSAAIAAYYESLEFRALKGGTPAMRRAILERFREQHGGKPIKLLPPKFIAHTLSKMTQPHAARNWLKAVRHLMAFCVAQEMIAAHPTQGIKLPSVKSDGIHTFTEDEISKYKAHYPLGTKAARTISASNSASGATPPVCRSAARFTGCARPDAVAWPSL